MDLSPPGQGPSEIEAGARLDCWREQSLRYITRVTASNTSSSVGGTDPAA